jgi:hypothetical protein
MTAARAFKVGYRKCTAPDCDHPVHYKVKECPSCGAVQMRVDNPSKGDAPSPSVGKATEQTAPRVLTAPPPEPPPVRGDGPYVVMADCRPQIDNVMAVLKRGAVLTDYRMIGQLLEAGAPIAPQNAAHGLTCCPHCQHVFAPQPLPQSTGRKAG